MFTSKTSTRQQRGTGIRRPTLTTKIPGNWANLLRVDQTSKSCFSHWPKPRWRWCFHWWAIHHISYPHNFIWQAFFYNVFPYPFMFLMENTYSPLCYRTVQVIRLVQMWAHLHPVPLRKQTAGWCCIILFCMRDIVKYLSALVTVLLEYYRLSQNWDVELMNYGWLSEQLSTSSEGLWWKIRNTCVYFKFMFYALNFFSKI